MLHTFIHLQLPGFTFVVYSDSFSDLQALIIRIVRENTSAIVKHLDLFSSVMSKSFIA